MSIGSCRHFARPYCLHLQGRTCHYTGDRLTNCTAVTACTGTGDRLTNCTAVTACSGTGDRLTNCTAMTACTGTGDRLTNCTAVTACSGTGDHLTNCTAVTACTGTEDWLTNCKYYLLPTPCTSTTPTRVFGSILSHLSTVECLRVSERMTVVLRNKYRSCS